MIVLIAVKFLYFKVYLAIVVVEQLSLHRQLGLHQSIILVKKIRLGSLMKLWIET